ncbi:conserved hypothetical protein [Acinetobacter baylyi ADP1]|uniref:Uncharacterized protein n=2 Tax=Acinetobacter baylyi TaxID=202950 RepID=Q6FDD4_ACIAD|nr:conserved hypothetical protein [Acinetobacter baylyi ADP1]
MMNLLSLDQYKANCFDQLALKIQQHPERYLDFDSVSDLYKADWLNEFPQGTEWSVSGLDDGADEFYILIQFKQKKLIIEIRQGHNKIDINL